LPGFGVVDEVLQEGLPQALGDAPCTWPWTISGFEQHTVVVAGGVAHNLHEFRLLVDLDLANVAAVRKVHALLM
jgi:hypothetical protein